MEDMYVNFVGAEPMCEERASFITGSLRRSAEEKGTDLRLRRV